MKSVFGVCVALCLVIVLSLLGNVVGSFTRVVLSTEEVSNLMCLACDPPGYSCCDGVHCFYSNEFYLYHSCVDGGSIDAPSCCYSWTVVTWVMVIGTFAVLFGVIACCVVCWARKCKSNFSRRSDSEVNGSLSGTTTTATTYTVLPTQYKD